MSRRRAGAAGKSPIAPLDERSTEALAIAMALAPGVYVRNRMFEFYARTGAQRARARASTLRGIVPQLARACTVSLTQDPASRTVAGEPTWVLRYRIAMLRLSRVVELTPAELSALRLMAGRAGITCLTADVADRARVQTALARLVDLGGPVTSADIESGRSDG